MSDHNVSGASTTEGLPIAPSMSTGLAAVHLERHATKVSPRVAFVALAAMAVAFSAGFIAQGLTRLIALITNIAFFGRISVRWVSPGDNHLG